MTPRHRVLFVISSLQVGGMEKHTVSLVNLLDTATFELSLVTLRSGGPLEADLKPDQLRRRHCLDARGRLDIGAARRLRTWLDAHPQDLIVCVNEYPLLYVALALRSTVRRPVVADIFHTTLYRSWKERLQLLIYRPLFRRLNLLIYVSERQREYWRSRGLGPMRDMAIPNGIDLRHFGEVPPNGEALQRRAAAGFSESDYVIGICAALRPEKAHTDLLAAVARLRNMGYPARALIVGDGPERRNIEAQATQLGIHESVYITGLQTDVRPWLAAMDVFALASRSIETLSIAGLEAMAAARPLVLSRVGGADELVVSGANGLLFDPGDIAALTACLQKLFDADTRRRFGESSTARVRDHFSQQKMLMRYTGALKELCNIT